jgi:hypothetical protein
MKSSRNDSFTHLKNSVRRDSRMQKKLPFWAKEMYNIAR